MSITLTSASFDKASYEPGDVITLTIGYTSTDTQPNPAAGTATFTANMHLSDDSSGISPNPTIAPSTLYQVITPDTEPQPIAVSATDAVYPSGTPTGRPWTLVSHDLLHFDSGAGISTWEAVLSISL